MSPKDGGFSRSQSTISDDYSGVPPEEPEWLSKMAARAYHLALSGRSRPASRRDSGLAGCPAVRPPGVAVPSPLRSSLNVASLLAEDAMNTSGSGAPSPRTFDRGHQALFDRFGSFEGMSAAVDDFYHRLCRDERFGETIKQVPEPDVRQVLMQLMALSVQQHQQHGRVVGASSPELRDRWMKHCRSLLYPGRGQQQQDRDRDQSGPQQEQQEEGDGAVPELSAEDTAAVYDAVMQHLLATLEWLGVSGADVDGEEVSEEEDDEADEGSLHS